MSSVRGPTRLDSSCRMLKKNGYSNVLRIVVQGKCFAEDPGTEKEHGNIEDLDKGCDRYMEHILTESASPVVPPVIRLFGRIKKATATV